MRWKYYILLLSSMCDCLWDLLDLLDNFIYLYAKRAKASAPTAERAKSTQSAVSAPWDVKSNPKNCTLSAAPGVGSVGVISAWENNDKVLVQSLGNCSMQEWALLLPACTRLLTVSWRSCNSGDQGLIQFQLRVKAQLRLIAQFLIVQVSILIPKPLH